jgi:RNA polymerase sigma-70 factor (ECF subfamily)
MHSSISRDDLQILLHEADIAARRLVRQLRLPRADLDDVRQDLLVDLIARLPAYDADRGTLGAFAGAILANRATRIANKAKRERRMYGATPISLAAEERLDVERGLGSLEPADGALCAALARTTVDRLATNGHGARSSIYRRIKDTRLALTAVGIRAA